MRSMRTCVQDPVVQSRVAWMILVSFLSTQSAALDICKTCADWLIIIQSFKASAKVQLHLNVNPSELWLVFCIKRRRKRLYYTRYNALLCAAAAASRKSSVRIQSRRLHQQSLLRLFVNAAQCIPYRPSRPPNPPRFRERGPKSARWTHPHARQI